MNLGSFAPDTNKQKQKKGKKKVDDETVGAIIESVDESSPVDTPSVECDPTADDDPESEDSDSLDASVFSVDEESHTSSESEEVNNHPDAQTIMEHVLALVESEQEADRFDLMLMKRNITMNVRLCLIMRL